MRRATLIRRVCVAAALLVTTVGLGAPASADAPFAYGWWSATNLGPLPNAGGALPDVLGPIAVTTPDVPPDGMLVQGGALGPIAYAALVYDLGPGGIADQLVLPVADGTTVVPGVALRLCPLADPNLTPAVGGPMAEAPAYDCSHEMSGTANDDGTAFVFAVDDLLTDGVLAVALLPTLPADRVVFAMPDDGSLLAEGAAPAPEPTPTTLPASLAGVAVGSGGRTTTFSTPSFSPSLPLAAAAAPAAATAAAPVAAPAATTRFPVSLPGKANALAVLGLAGALAVAGVLWQRAGRVEGVPST